MQPFHIAPSLLSADFARLGEEAVAVLDAGADRLHLDVMDNHYVPNLTVGPMVCQALRNFGIHAPIDVHLMVKPVDDLIRQFLKAGATTIVFHPEATEHVDRSLNIIIDAGCQAGLVLNPATSLSVLDYALENCDRILVMSVNPGFGGQNFIPSTLKKIEAIRVLIDKAGLKTRLEVDGGVCLDNIRAIADAGADTFVSGSAIFRSSNYKKTIDAMRDQLKK